jgi:hypothetical protein
MKSFVRFAVAISVLGCWFNRPARATQGAPDDYVSDEVNVVLQPGVSIDSINAQFGTTVIEQIPGTSYYRLLTPGGEDALELKTKMAGDGDLIASDPNFIFEDPEIRQSSQAFIDQSSQAFIDGQRPASFFAQPSIANLHLAQAQTVSRGAGVTVAVIDTGIDFDHPLFAGRIAPAYYDFVDNDSNPNEESSGVGVGHGTFVAGLIALAVPDAKIMPLRAFGPDGKGTSFNIAKAIRFARDNGANVINLSFGLIEPDGMIRDAINYAYSSAYLVSSSGNDNLEFLQFPGAISKMCSVASTTDADRKAPFSNFNKNIYVSAPGVSLYSAYPGGLWAYWSGTSFSTALVSAEVAQLIAISPRQNRSDLDKIVTSTGISIDSLNPSYSGKLGKRLDYYNAVKAVRR